MAEPLCAFAGKLYLLICLIAVNLLQARARAQLVEPSQVGIDYVLVNGQVVIDRGKHTGARPGHVIYGPGRIPNHEATGEEK